MSEETIQKPHKKTLRERAKAFASKWSIESDGGYKLTKGENLLARSAGRAILLHNGDWPLDDKANPVTRAAEARAESREAIRTAGRGRERDMTASEYVLGGLYELGTLSPLRLTAATAASSLLHALRNRKEDGLGRTGTFLRDAADRHLIKQENMLHNPFFRGSAGFNGREVKQYVDEEFASRRAEEASFVQPVVETEPSEPERYNPFKD